jgi:glycosyltransferase involved in cell wall biosynthesis/Tfp pilus assembly protein PilF
MSNSKSGISLCMIVKDEEHFLSDALRSVAGLVDEVCIVDTGSTDRSREIARAHGARVIDVPWQDDFAHARNAALSMATRPWIFVLDADERLEPGSRAALAAIGKTRPNGRGKWITCRNLTDDCKGSGAMSNALVRLFPNDEHLRYRNAIHEFVTRDGGDAGLAADRTAIEIVHHGYLSAVIAEREKGERNLRLSRIAAQRRPDDAFHQYNLGMASLLNGDHAGAIAALDRMRELTLGEARGFRVHALVVLADLYARYRNDLDTAHALVRECLAAVPNYSSAHFTQGKLLVRGGDLFEARNAFGRAIAAGAHDAEQFVVDDEIAIWKAHAEIGATLMLEGRYAEALRWFDLAAQARPAAQPLVINRAKCHEALGDIAAAETYFSAAFMGYRDEASAVEWINFLLRAGRTAEASAAVDTALPFVDADAGVLLLGTAAAAHLRAGSRDEAARAVRRALTLGTRSAGMLAALAQRLGTPQLTELLPAVQAPRAKARHIAYVEPS